MAKFINKQKHLYSCIPTAGANLLKALGYSITYNEALKFFSWDMKSGGFVSDLSQDLKDCGIKNKFYRLNKFSRVEKELDKGNFVLFSYPCTEPTHGRHIVYLTGHDKNYFYGYNLPSKNRISKAKLLKMQREVVWFWRRFMMIVVERPDE